MIKNTCVYAAVALILLAARASFALKVQDVTRLKGEMPGKLVGMGLVFGLDGSGDGGDFLPAMRSLQQMLGKFQNPVAIARELKNANNVALVWLSVTVPPAGAREGDKLDVHISAIAAKSLQNGRLFLSPLQGMFNDTHIYAAAEGALQVDDDKAPTTATIKGGATIGEDIINQSVQKGRFTLVLSPTAATYATASAIADQINEDVATQTNGQAIAAVEDSTSVVVQIPASEAEKPAAFIARVQALQVPVLSSAAKVLINSKTGTIVFTGDVELSPTTISHNGLTISVAQNNPAAPGADPAAQKAASLKELVEAFNLMRIGAKDRITIVKELYDSGALRCQMDGE